MTGKEWLAVYEQSGEMPPAGVLARQLASMDAEIEALTRRNAELTAALEYQIAACCGDCVTCNHARRALTPTESEAK